MKKPSLTDHTIKGVLWVFSGHVSQATLSIIVMMIQARLLSPKDFGIVGAAMVVVGFSQIFSDLGIAPAIVQRQNLGVVHIRIGFTLSIAMGIMVGLIFTLSAPLLADFFRIPELTKVVQTLALVFPISGMGIVGQAILRREMQFGRLAAIGLTSYLLGYGILGIILAASGWGYWALVAAHLTQTVVQSSIILMMKREVIGFSLQGEGLRQLLNLSAGFSLARIFNYLATQADNLVVGRWLGAEALGIYGRIYQFLMLPANLVGGVVDKVLFPAMASVQDDKIRLGRAYTRAVAVVTMLTLPLSGFLIILAPEIIYVLLGTQWMAVVVPFQIMAGFLVFRTSYKISDSLARATGAVYRRAWRQCLYAIAVFLGAWVGQLWGLIGVAFGVSAAITLNFLLMLRLSSQLVLIPWREVGGVHLRYTVIAGSLSVAIWGFKLIAGRNNLPPLLLISLSAVIAIITVMLLWRMCQRLFGEEGAWFSSKIKQYSQVLAVRLGIDKWISPGLRR